MDTKMGTVVGVFHDREQARHAVSQLRRAGFRDDQIGVIARDASDRTEVAGDATGNHAEEGAIAGVAAGAGVGALWGLGIAAGLLPGIGPVIAGGTLAAIMASAATGAAAAGIAGGLIGAGIPEEEAQGYEREFHAGRTLVTVKAGGREAEARGILDSARRGTAAASTAAPSMQAGGTGAASTAAMSSAASSTGAACDTDVRQGEGKTMKLHEERLRVDKQPVETGEVRLRKEVVTEHQTIDVPVTREEVVIERHPVAGGQATSGDLKSGEEIRIPVREEQVRVEKQAVVKEEVSLGKRKVTDTQKVDETVRHEELRVDKEGKVNVRGDQTRR